MRVEWFSIRTTLVCTPRSCKAGWVLDPQPIVNGQF